MSSPRAEADARASTTESELGGRRWASPRRWLRVRAHRPAWWTGRARNQPPGCPPRGCAPNQLSISGSCHARTVRRDSRNSTLSDRWRRRVLLYSRPSTPLHRRLQRTAGDGSPARVGGWPPGPPREDEGLAPPPARADTMRVPRPLWAAAEFRASPPSWPRPRASRSPPAPGRPPSPPSAHRAGAPWRSGT